MSDAQRRAKLLVGSRLRTRQQNQKQQQHKQILTKQNQPINTANMFNQRFNSNLKFTNDKVDLKSKGKTTQNVAPPNRNQVRRSVMDLIRRRHPKDSKQHLKTTQKPPQTTRDRVLELEAQLSMRSRRLTVCLLCLMGSLASLSPFLYFHLKHRVGMLLFESHLLELAAHLVTVIVASISLVILHGLLSRLGYQPNSGRRFQRVLRALLGLFALLAGVSYLGLGLLVPQVRQSQRQPVASFDCNANVIIIENCQQQFDSLASLDASLLELLTVVPGQQSSRGLARKLDCLRYNDKRLGALQVPTRFLFQKCALVCQPHQQQVHQFGDLLNRAQADSLAQRAPYDRATQTSRQDSQLDDSDQPTSRHLTYRNGTSSQTTNTDSTETPSSSKLANLPQVSVKVCFSGEFSSGANYKRYCITNLARGQPTSRGLMNTSGPDGNIEVAGSSTSSGHTLTVGQLNAILKRYTDPFGEASTSGDSQTTIAGSSNTNEGSRNAHDLTGTHYVNPVVQFESHFKSWTPVNSEKSHLEQNLRSTHSAKSSYTTLATDHDWCRFKPMQPFIVNNKPFSEIQCSLEQEYTLAATGSDSVTYDSSSLSDETPYMRDTNTLLNSNKIYLQKTSKLDGSGMFSNDQHYSSYPGERCNIQCQMNILYQVRPSRSSTDQRMRTSGTSFSSSSKNHQRLEQHQMHHEDGQRHQLVDHYYLPLKPCLVVSNPQVKSEASNLYLIFRSVADSSLYLLLLLLDLYLLLETVDTKRFSLESKVHFRLIGSILASALVPLLIALMFDLMAQAKQNGSILLNRDSSTWKFLSDTLLPFLNELPYKLSGRSSSTSSIGRNNNQQSNSSATNGQKLEQNQEASSLDLIDIHLLPFFVNAILMFIFFINSLSIPLIRAQAPLIRVASTEALGLTRHNQQASSPTPSHNINTTNSNLSSPKNGNCKLQSQLANADLNSGEKYPRNCLLWSQLILLMLLACFMGALFNLGQLGQREILIETFGHADLVRSSLSSLATSITTTTSTTEAPKPIHEPTSVKATNSNYQLTAFWFVLATRSGWLLLVALATSLFAQETSNYLSQFAKPFQESNMPSSPVVSEVDGNSIESNKFDRKTGKQVLENQASLLKYLSVSMLVYAARFYLLAHYVTPTNWFRWLVVLVVQLSELANLPLVWFALCRRAHQLLIEMAQFWPHKDRNESFSINSRLERHLGVQSALALSYFVLGRCIALGIYVINASLYLHSEDVDWFIRRFYPPDRSKLQKQVTITSASTSDPRIQQKHLSNNSIEEASSNAAKLLFSPLPAERETYLHASRQVLEIGSIVSLVLGLAVATLMAYVVYQLWLMQRVKLQLAAATRLRASGEFDSDELDERLRSDLRLIQMSNRNTSSQSAIASGLNNNSGSSRGQKADESDSETSPARAKVLFRYQINPEPSVQPEKIQHHHQKHMDRVDVERERQMMADTDQTTPISRQSMSPKVHVVPIHLEMDDHQQQQRRQNDRESPSVLSSSSEIGRGRIGQEKHEEGPRWSHINHHRERPEGYSDEAILERVSSHHSKRISLLEEEEEEADEFDSAQIGAEEGDSIDKPVSFGAGDQLRRHRSISFAPTTTIIGQDGAKEAARVTSNTNSITSSAESGNSYETSQRRARFAAVGSLPNGARYPRVPAMYASPEESMGGTSDDDDDLGSLR